MAEQCFHEGDRLNIKGMLRKRTFYGPPNFGETPKTDKLVTVFVLRPDRPLIPCDNPDFDNANRGNAAPANELVVIRGRRHLRSGEQSLIGRVYHSDNASQFLNYIFELD